VPTHRRVIQVHLDKKIDVGYIYMRRLVWFSVGCVGIRSLLPVAAGVLGSRDNRVTLGIMGVVCLLIGLSFAIQYTWHDDRTNAQGGFGGPVWWNNMRVIHAVLYLLFGVLVIADRSYRSAWVVLAVDIILSCLVVLRRHMRTIQR
jgi:hypothetical protein